MFRDGDSESLADVVRGLRSEYDEAMKKSGFQVREALQDSMLSLKVLMDIIHKHSGHKAIEDWKNAYMAENALSSRNQAEQTEYKRKFYQPLLEAMRALVKGGMSEQQVSQITWVSNVHRSHQ